jgi:hypothetical protein
MEGRFVGISTRQIPIINEFGETLFNWRTVFSAPLRLLRILFLLEAVPPQPAGTYDIPELQRFYLTHREVIQEDFNISCEEITTRIGDFTDPTECGDLELPNPVCPLCEIKLRLFKAIHFEENSETKAELESDLDFLFTCTRGYQPE